MQTVGVIGLGIMGKPMARNLLAAGHSVVVHNRSRAAVDELAALGAEAASGPADVAARCDAVVLSLPDSPDVADVVLGSGGVLEGASAGLLLIDTSTIAPQAWREVANACEAKGVRALDAPVSGGEQGAVDGTLSIMVGGQADAFAAAGPVLDVLGATVVRVGPAGAGQTVKAVNQLLVAGTIQLVSEGIVLLETCGVEMDPAVRVLAGGLAGNAILERKAAGMLRRDFEPGFRVDLHHKDLGITLETARAQGVAVPMTALVAQLIGALRATGRGSLDHTALLQLVEDLSGHGSTGGADAAQDTP